MAITNVDPASLGSFNETNIVLLHDDEVPTAMWNRFVQNGATSYAMWRDAIATSRPSVFESTQYACIPPSPVGVMFASGLAEKAAVHYTIVWQTVTGVDTRGKVRLMGGTDIDAMGTLDEHALGAASGTYHGSAASPIDIPSFVISGGSTWALPYWVAIETDNPAATTMLASSLNIRYSRYPVIT